MQQSANIARETKLRPADSGLIKSPPKWARHCLLPAGCYRGCSRRRRHSHNNKKAVGFMDDREIEFLLKEPKHLETKGRWSTQGKFKKRNDVLVSPSSGQRYQLFQRQSLKLRSSFSCGLLWTPANKGALILARYNGPSHNHSNPIEGDLIVMQCHIHVATNRYIESDRKAEHYAQMTERYTTLESAFFCILTDCNIHGYEARNNGSDNLFPEH